MAASAANCQRVHGSTMVLAKACFIDWRQEVATKMTALIGAVVDKSLRYEVVFEFWSKLYEPVHEWRDAALGAVVDVDSYIAMRRRSVYSIDYDRSLTGERDW